MGVSRRAVLRGAVAGVASAVVTACEGNRSAGPRGAAAPGVGPTRAPSPPPSPGPRPTLPAEVDSGPPDRPLVALTFHGAGSPALATALLGCAERGGARVTVLAVGTWLGEAPQLARRVLAAGHELGNHTERHGDMAAMDADAVYAEIRACADRLRALTGSPGRWFRPSRMWRSTGLVRAQARRAGYPTVLSYGVDSLDYTDPGADAVTANVLDLARPGAIVSLHMGHDGTVRALPAVLAGLRARGLRAVTAGELLRG